MEDLRSLQFKFRPALRAIGSGVGVGIVLVALLFAWAAWTGRIKHIDTTYAGILVGATLGAAGFVGWRFVSTSHRRAAALGALDIDARGLCWRRGDGSVVFEARWEDIENATVDRRIRQVLFVRREAGPLLFGDTTGFVEIENLTELQTAIASRVPVEQHAGSGNRKVGRRLVLSAMLYLLVGSGLYAVNRVLADWLHFTRLLSVMPAVVAGVGIILGGAGLRILLGRGPMVSSLYNPGHPRSMLRFLVVATIANFALLALFNAIGP